MYNRITNFLVEPRPSEAGRSWDAGPGKQWRETLGWFLKAVDPHQRSAVAALLRHLPNGSLGLHSWLCVLAWGGGFLPAHIPHEVVQVYLKDPEAAPLFECTSCHLALPVRLGAEAGSPDPPAHIYFPNCPRCGGLTDWCSTP